MPKIEGVSFHNYRKMAFLCGAALTILTPSISYAHGVNFNIKEQDATTGILEFGKQARAQIIAPGKHIRGKTTNAVQGSIEVRKALDQLLEGTGLRVVADDENTFTLSPMVHAFFRPVQIAQRSQSTVPIPSPAVPAALPSQEAQGFGDVVVTARRREETLQSAPVSVTAFSAESLSQRSVSSFNNLTNFVPNIEINNGRVDGGGSTAQIFIRGVGQDDYAFPLDPGVGVYLDGVYVSRSSAGDFGFLDVERIEILRGPQGTLYGKNTIGGAVNVVTRRPTGSNTGHIEVTTGRFDRLDVNGAFDAKITDTVSASLAVASVNRDGVGRSLAGDELGNQNRDSIRGQLRFQPHSDLDVLVIADKSRQRQFGPLGSLRAYFPWPPLDQFYNENLAPAIADRFSLTGDEAVYGPAYVNRMDETKRRYSGAGKQTKDNNDIWGVSLTVDYSLGALDFKSISAYREVSFEVASDPDHTPFDIVDRNVEEDSEQLSQEFQLSGDVLDDKLSFIMGLYALQEKGKNRAFVPILTGIENILGDIISQDFDGSIKSSSYAVFGEATWNFSEQFAVTVGGRLNYDKKRYKFSLRRYFSQELLVGPFDLEESWTKFLPKVGLEFNPSDDIMAFATFSQGYKAGGWNPRAQPGDTDPNSFDPEDLTSYEFGLKTSLLDNRLILNTAAFYSDYKEIQLSAVTVRPDGSPETRVVNGGKARIYGFEAELNARPTPDLTLVAGFGYLDAKYKQLDADVMAVGIGIDNKLPQIPRITFNAQANYTIDLPRRARFVLSGDTTYKSKIHRSVQNFPELLTPSYWLFNSRLTFLDASDRYELAAFVTNITNKMYLTSGVDVRALGFVESYYSRPREWGLSVKVKF